MSKKQSILLCGLFLLFLAVFSLLNLFWPDREFSEMENRTLANNPPFSFQALFSGQWTTDYETYLTDQFPLRDTWVGIKYVCERAMLRQENNGIYFAGDRLIARFDPPDEPRVEQNFAAIDALAQNTGLPTRFMLVPTSAYIYQDELPVNAPSYDQQQLLDRASQLQQAENIPVHQALLDAREEYIYYRTDHHWTTKGAYLAYEAYMKAAGREDEILTQGSMARVNPPLRTAKDIKGIITGLKDGTIDAIATDHAPHSAEEKTRPLTDAPSGMVGLETALAVALTYLYHTGEMALSDILRRMTINPACILRLPTKGRLAIGSDGDVVIFDPDEAWTVDPNRFASKGRNTPFAGKTLRGKVKYTIVGGEIVYWEGE